MRVLFIPFAKSNKYHDLLISELHKNNIETLEGDLTRATFFPLIYHSRHYDVDMVHISWPHLFFVVTGLSQYSIINVVASTVKSLCFIFDIIAFRFFGNGVVWTFHNKYNHEKRHLWIESLVRKFLPVICSGVIVHCNEGKRIVQNQSCFDIGKKVEVVPHGNYIDAYPNTVSKSEARNSVDINRNDFVFLFFGQIRPYKGVFTLVNEFQRSDVENAVLLIVGSPSDQETETRLSSISAQNPNVETVLQFIPDDDIQYYMNAADVVVLPYRDVLTSGGAMLAMSFGKPVIAPELGCLPEMLTQQKSLLYDPGSNDGLSDALESAYRSKSLSRVGKLNMERAEDLSWDHIAKETKRVYAKIHQD